MNLSRVFWILTWVTMAFGFFIAILGAYLETAGATSGVGLYMIIIGPLVAGLSGVWAQLAAKYQAEQMQTPTPLIGTKEKIAFILKNLGSITNLDELEERALKLGISKEEFDLLIAVLRERSYSSDEESVKAEKAPPQRPEP